MRCPFCREPDTRVVDSRERPEGDAIRRRRECPKCGRRFTTHERADLSLPVVVKKDGRREAFDRRKIVSGLTRACEKRAISADVVEGMADRIERQMQERGDKEVTSREIGEAVMRELHALDAVAYVRFASVYRSFGDVQEFTRAVEDLLAERQRGARPATARRGRRERG
jgi:transcriptional repressor NrdR